MRILFRFLAAGVLLVSLMGLFAVASDMSAMTGQVTCTTHCVLQAYDYGVLDTKTRDVQTFPVFLAAVAIVAVIVSAISRNWRPSPVLSGPPPNLIKIYGRYRI